MFKRKIDSLMKKTENESQANVEKSAGFLQKASDFITRHIQKGERLLEIEKLEKEYALDEYMSGYMEAFDQVDDYESARTKVLETLVDEYLAEVPDKDKFTFTSTYIEKRIDELFAEEIQHYEKNKRLKDLFEARAKKQE